MAVTTLDGYIGAAKQRVLVTKTASRTSVAANFSSMFDIAGNPGAGTLAGTSTTAGVVPTDATAGYPTINAFGGGNTGYVGRLEFSNSVTGRIVLYDRLFVCGAYAFNANTALSSQPSYSSRLPNTDYTGLEIWVEQVTAATGNQAVNVTYTNEAGTGSRTTGAVGVGAAPIVGRCWQLPLQAGDEGVQKIDNVAGSVATAGTFNVMILRRLATARINIANQAIVQSLFDTGMPQIYEDSALFPLIAGDSTSTGLPDILIEVVNG